MLEWPLSTHGESGSAGDRRDRVVVCDLDRSRSASWSLILVVLLLRLWALPLRAWDFWGVPLGLEGTFQVTLDGVVGREDGEGDASGW